MSKDKNPMHSGSGGFKHYEPPRGMGGKGPSGHNPTPDPRMPPKNAPPPPGNAPPPPGGGGGGGGGGGYG